MCAEPCVPSDTRRSFNTRTKFYRFIKFTRENCSGASPPGFSAAYFDRLLLKIQKEALFVAVCRRISPFTVELGRALFLANILYMVYNEHRNYKIYDSEDCFIMTAMPKVGFLCTGKNPLELAASIHCQTRMTPLLRENGFAVGGCYTELIECDSPEKIKRVGKTLEHLCHANDLVLTLGCEGFAAGDVIPDVTEVVCPTGVAYFTNLLCGSQSVYAGTNAALSHQNPQVERLFSDDAPEAPVFRPRSEVLHKHPLLGDNRAPFSARLRRAVNALRVASLAPTASDKPAEAPFRSRMSDTVGYRIFSETHKVRPSGRSACPTDRTETPTAPQPLCVPPSRARAGIMEKALLLNFSANACTALPLLQTLLGTISFSVCHLSGKSAAAGAAFEKSLKNEVGLDESLQTYQAVNK